MDVTSSIPAATERPTLRSFADLQAAVRARGKAEQEKEDAKFADMITRGTRLCREWLLATIPLLNDESEWADYGWYLSKIVSAGALVDELHEHPLCFVEQSINQYARELDYAVSFEFRADGRNMDCCRNGENTTARDRLAGGR
jgi:hypothetical protein